MKRFNIHIILLCLIISNACERFDRTKIPKALLDSLYIENNTGKIYLYGSVVHADDERISDHGFCWAILSQPTINDEYVSLGASSSINFSYILDSLNEKTTYYFCSFIEYDEKIEYSTQKSIMYCNDSIVVLTDSVQIDVNSGSVILYATIIGNLKIPLSDHGFCYSLEQNPTTDNYLISLGKKSESGNYNITLNDLENPNQYYFRSFIKDNEEIYGNIKEIYYGNNIIITTVPIANSNPFLFIFFPLLIIIFIY